MKLSIKEHKTPIAVTAVGLLVAIGLASAPSLMAESETDIRAAKNSDELEKLSASVEGQSAQMQQQLDSLESSISSRFSSIENQINTLNKATKRLHLKQQASQDTPVVSVGEFSSLENQVKTLHKATKQLHLRQKSAEDAKASEAKSQEPNTVVLSSIGALEKKTDARVTNLEKAVTNLNKKHQVTLSAIAAVETLQAEAEAEVATVVATAVATQASQSSQNSTTTDTVSEETTRRRLEVDIRILQLERAIIQLGKKLDSMEVATKQVDPNIERLQEIRRNADRLLKKITQ